jgi:hypothetical protein
LEARGVVVFLGVLANSMDEDTHMQEDEEEEEVEDEGEEVGGSRRFKRGAARGQGDGLWAKKQQLKASG